MTRRIRRWGDNDRHFGPFTYSADSRSRLFGVMLGSGGGDDYPGAFIRFHAFTHTLILEIPAILKPARVWVDKTPSLGYWGQYARQYGFTATEGALHVHYGPQTNDSTTDHSRCLFIPWTQWRHVRTSLYGIDGGHVWTASGARKGDGFARWEETRKARDACPAAKFEFDDFDGERITVATRIEEREWLAGTGWFRWLSIFRKPKVSRSLDLAFLKETGPKKGSWKGGTVGHSIEMLPGELHEAAFRRYCAGRAMTFVGRIA